MQFLTAIKTKIDEIRLLDAMGPGFIDTAKKAIDEDICLLIQKSVLSGEYYHPETKLLITSIYQVIDELEGSLTAFTHHVPLNNALSKTGIITINVILQHIKDYKFKYLNKFRDLNQSVMDNLISLECGNEGVIQDIQLYRNFKLKNDLTSRLGTDPDLNDNFNETLFDINILLAYHDDYLECDDQMLRDLRSIKSFLLSSLKNEQNTEISQLLGDKSEFLEHKILWRHCHTDGHLISDYPALKATTFRSFESKMKFHYSPLKKASVAEIENRIGHLNAHCSTPVRLEDFHHIIRYYRRDHPDDLRFRKGRIEHFIDKLEPYHQHTGHTNFDIIGIRSIKTLMHATIIDLEFQVEKQSSFKNIIKEFKIHKVKCNGEHYSKWLADKFTQIHHKARENNFPDYFGFKVYLDFIRSLTLYLQSRPSEIFDTGDEPLNKDQFEQYKNEAIWMVKYLENIYSVALKEIKQSLKTMMTHEVKPVYMTHTECFLPYQWKDGIAGRLFIDSSYILPNDFRTVREQIIAYENAFNSKVLVLQNSYQSWLNQTFVDTLNVNFDKKVKDNEIKLVQIIAMFVSIATFVLINVKIFDNRTGLESFGILLGLAACFFIFNLFFYFLILAQLKKSRVVWRRVAETSVIAIIPLVFGAACYFILKAEDGRTGGELRAIKDKMYIDSLAIRKVIGK